MNGVKNTTRRCIENKLHLSALKLIFIIRYLPLIYSLNIIDAYNLYWRMGSLKHGTPKTPHFNSGRTRTRPCVHCGVFFFDNEKLLNHERSHEEDKNGNDQKTPHFNSGRTRQCCNEDSSKILGEGHWYWIYDFVATFGENDRPIHMALCS